MIVDGAQLVEEWCGDDRGRLGRSDDHVYPRVADCAVGGMEIGDRTLEVGKRPDENERVRSFIWRGIVVEWR